MIEFLTWRDLSVAEKKRALSRAPYVTSDQLKEDVRAILAGVKRGGDSAVRLFTAQFDKVDQPVACVSRAEMREAVDNLSPELRRSIEVAIRNITAFHTAQKQPPIRVETMPGVVCEMVSRPVGRVGLYVPCGLAPLFSAVLMLAIPARLAGCAQIVLASPPQKNGRVNSGILAAAALCGVEQVLPAGGAQAVAAMAYGTESVPKADKVAGPGNAFVTMAKQLVAEDPGGAAIDLPAGPSEVMVLADAGQRADWIAADLLAQAEHGRDSQALLITPSQELAVNVQAEVERQAALLPRAELVRASLANSRAIIVSSMAEGIEVANLYAPEHLIIQANDAAGYVAEVQTAGAVFVGAFAPETAGDYATGGNHVLPTYGYGRAYGGVSLQTFLRTMTVQTLTQDGLTGLAPTLIALARAEGLEGHAAAVSIRGVRDAG